MNEIAQPLALHPLLEALESRNYHFVAPTPATHARVVARRMEARDLRDVFGWSLPFSPRAIDPEIVAVMESAGVLQRRGPMLASAVRASSLEGRLFLHSAYPTDTADSVFFGPDSYRFAAFLQRELPRLPARRHIVDVGTGSGVGAIVAAPFVRGARVSLVDTNPKALAFAKANMLHAESNARISGVETWRLIRGDGVSAVDNPIDCVIANPPYIADPLHRAYRDGGGMHGGEISLRWAEEAAEKLAPGGALLLYTGGAIVGGEDRLRAALEKTLAGFDVSYQEIDPDVFGEELERGDYADVERIAVVGVVAVKR